MVSINEELEICVLMGGTSSEREVSLNSGSRVYDALGRGRDEFHPIRGEFSEEGELLDTVAGSDLVFNTLHGGIGEDGTVQVLLDLLGIPYTGTGPLGSAIAMDKLASKRAFHRASIETPSYYEKSGGNLEGLVDQVSQSLTYPVVAKPQKEGSSRGVRIADDEDELREDLRNVEEEYGEVFVESYISGREVTVGVLESDGKPEPLPLVELEVKQERFFNYKAKYTPGETEFIVPARVTDKLAEKVKRLAVRAHEEFGCRGYSRVDFIIEEAEYPYALEVNTLPGMTEMSDLPLAAEAAGIEYDELVERMVASVLDREKLWG